MPTQRRPRIPTVNLTLTEELIRDAIPRDSSHCMWADAVKAAVPGARSVSVDLQTIRFTDPEKPLRYTFLTPRLAQSNLIDFDQHEGQASDKFIQKWAGAHVQLKGGQVTKAALKSSHARTRGEGSVPDRAELRAPTANHSPRHVPDKIGGRTPPVGPLTNTQYGAGKRRAFGLRGLVL
jgi:hypothetical protein